MLQKPQQSITILMPETPFLDIFSGDKAQFSSNSEAYAATAVLLASKSATYGLPPTPEELDEEQQGILNDLSVRAIPPLIHRRV